MNKRTKLTAHVDNDAVCLFDSKSKYHLSVAQSKRLRGQMRSAEKRLKNSGRRVRLARQWRRTRAPIGGGG